MGVIDIKTAHTALIIIDPCTPMLSMTRIANQVKRGIYGICMKFPFYMQIVVYHVGRTDGIQYGCGNPGVIRLVLGWPLLSPICLANDRPTGNIFLLCRIAAEIFAARWNTLEWLNRFLRYSKA
jgi:hypothetical protein